MSTSCYPADMAQTERKVSAKLREQPRKEPPLDDEPLTPEDLKAIAQARAEFARGDYCTLEELEANVARLRSQVRPKSHRARPRR